MSAITIDIPDSLFRKLDERVREEHLTFQEFAVSALAEKLSNILTADYLEQRASRGDIEHFRNVLARVPDAEPSEEDRF